MDWILFIIVFAIGWACGTLSSKRGANGASLGIVATILAFIGLS